jgi:murein DD-endopeptidase MepM/ murein hydrolase activator NlpD
MARKEKFRFNPATLSYEKVEVSFGEKLLKSLLVIAPAIILGFAFQFMFSAWFKSPNEIALENELNVLKTQLKIDEENLALSEKVVNDLIKRDDEIYRVLFNAEPFDRNMSTGGTKAETYKKLEGYSFSEKLISNAKRLKVLEQKIYTQSLSYDEVIELAKEKEKMLASIPSIQPVANKDLRRVASGYGWRIDPHYHTKRMHWGLDFTASTGTNVYSSGNGKVVAIEQKRWGYGNCIVVDHGYGYKSRYAHLSAFNVKLGDIVTRGEIIGYVGSTGKSTAPHLHYEVEKNGKKVNPTHFFHSDLTPEEFEKMIEMSTNANQSFD